MRLLATVTFAIRLGQDCGLEAPDLNRLAEILIYLVQVVGYKLAPNGPGEGDADSHQMLQKPGAGEIFVLKDVESITVDRSDCRMMRALNSKFAVCEPVPPVPEYQHPAY